MVSGNFRLTADDAEFPILFDAGSASAIWFSCDTSYADSAHNIVAGPKQSLRVVVVDKDGTIQGPPTHILVGRDPKTGLAPVGVHFPSPKTANWVAIAPGPDGPSDKRVAFWVG